MKKMWYVSTMEYHSAIKKKQDMNFTGKRMYLENNLSEVAHSPKYIHSIYSLISGY